MERLVKEARRRGAGSAANVAPAAAPPLAAQPACPPWPRGRLSPSAAPRARSPPARRGRARARRRASPPCRCPRRRPSTTAACSTSTTPNFAAAKVGGEGGGGERRTAPHSADADPLSSSPGRATPHPRAASAPPPTRGRYHIRTFGCQMNLADSERMAGALDAAGWGWTDEVDEAKVTPHPHPNPNPTLTQDPNPNPNPNPNPTRRSSFTTRAPSGTARNKKSTPRSGRPPKPSGRGATCGWCSLDASARKRAPPS